MPYAIEHPVDGTFVGSGLGLAYFSRRETAGQIQAVTTEDRAEALEIIKELESFSIEGLQVVEVASGHWSDLEAAGLDVGDMAENEFLHSPAPVSYTHLTLPTTPYV